MHGFLQSKCLLLTQSGHWPQGQLADNRLREQPPQVTNKQRNGQEVAMRIFQVIDSPFHCEIRGDSPRLRLRHMLE